MGGPSLPCAPATDGVQMDQVKQRLHTLLSTDAPIAELAEQLDSMTTPALQRSLSVMAGCVM
jgi:hypothetical protein